MGDFCCEQCVYLYLCYILSFEYSDLFDVKDIDMFSIAVTVLIMIALLLTIGSVYVFQEQYILECEDQKEDEPFVTRPFNKVDVMIEDGFCHLLSFENIKKDNEIEGPKTLYSERSGESVTEN